jgi:hypothetical protein
LIGVPIPDLTIEQRRALQLLAKVPNGMPDPALRSRGFSPVLIVGLVGADVRPNWLEQAERESLTGKQWRD